ncbi:MAG: hypothetical protein LLF76_12425 [Planctomycetaceae bacterium]|nr:hypothetical protein [Planctomycetaceae bacterium]
MQIPPLIILTIGIAVVLTFIIALRMNAFLALIAAAVLVKMSGLSEIETLKTWTPTVSLLALIGLVVTLLFSILLPLT